MCSKSESRKNGDMRNPQFFYNDISHPARAVSKLFFLMESDCTLSGWLFSFGLRSFQELIFGRVANGKHRYLN